DTVIHRLQLAHADAGAISNELEIFTWRNRNYPRRIALIARDALQHTNKLLRLTRRHAHVVTIVTRGHFASQFRIQGANEVDAGVGSISDELQTGSSRHLDHVVSHRYVGLNAFEAVLLRIFGNQDHRQDVGHVVARFLGNVRIDHPVVSRTGASDTTIDVT